MARRGRVVVVGLGPAGLDLLVPAARDAIERASVRYARTLRHPAVAQLANDGVPFESFDASYDAGGDLDTVYASIVDALVDAANVHGDVLYAVPGNPAVAERTVALLRARDVDVDVVPGLSFADHAWSRVGVDPMHGARIDIARQS